MIEKAKSSLALSTAPAPSGVRPAEDARCIADVLSGKRERFGELVERYKGAVAAVVRGYVRDSHQVEDVAQEVFLNAYTALPQLRDPKLFFSWLMQAARHRAIHAARRGERAAGQQPLTGSEALAEKDDSAAQRLGLVMRQVEQLEEPYRQTILLKYERGLSCKEIAEHEGVAIGTVTSRLTRALVMLRSSLVENK